MRKKAIVPLTLLSEILWLKIFVSVQVISFLSLFLVAYREVFSRNELAVYLL